MLNRIDVENNPVNWVDPWGLRLISGGIGPTIEKHTSAWFKKIKNIEKKIADQVFRKATGLPGPTGPQAIGTLLRGAGGALLWELTHPTPLGDGTLAGKDIDGDGIPDFPDDFDGKDDPDQNNDDC